MAFNSSMPMFWGDYLRDTGHLSAAEHGAYLLLIAHQWTTAKPLPNDDMQLARIARMSPREWRTARRMLEDFFDVSETSWTQGRVARELQRALEVYEQRRRGGVNSGEKRRGIKQSSNTVHNSPPVQHIADRQVPEPEPKPESKEDGGVGRAGAPDVPRETPPEDKPVGYHPRFHEVGAFVLRAMGVADSQRWTGNYALADAWLKAGFDAEADIFPVVTQLAATKAPCEIKSLKFFTEAIARHHAERMDPLAIPDTFKRGNNGQRPNPQHRNGFAQIISEFGREAGDPGGLGGQADVVAPGDL